MSLDHPGAPEPKFDVIAIAIEATSEALDNLLQNSGCHSWSQVARDLEGARADEIVDGLAEYNFDVDAVI